MKGFFSNLKKCSAALILLIAGCSIVEFFGLGRESQRPFRHRTHVEDVGMGCEDCHTKYGESEIAGMPAMETCLSCHEDLDQQQPEEKRLATLYGKEPEWSQFTILPDEVIFSHKTHLDKNVSCADCHGPLEKNEGVTGAVFVSKDACMKCHQTTKLSNSCTVCHTTIGKDTVPGSHRTNWKSVHGTIVRSGNTESSENRCSLCHAESSCTACHKEEAPRNHTNFWRIQGHGIASSVDRSSCITCHRTDFCDRCHRETSPRSHRAAWGSPRDQHCNSCHLPLKSEGCAMCHKTAPSHLQAAPKPANHNAGMNCRQCHGPGLAQPLPHPDKGDNCNACHR